MVITEAMVSAKRDGIIYAAFDCKEDFMEIRLRIAESNNHEIMARDFIPPQIYERFMYMNKLCKKMRDNDPKLKTQIRFGDK